MIEPSRSTRRPLMLEVLEPRVYLSGGNHDQWTAAAASGAGLRALAESLLGTRLGSVAEVQSFTQADTQASVLVVNVNGNADSSDALLGRFDGATGELLESFPITNGQIVLVTNRSGLEIGSWFAPQSASTQPWDDLILLGQEVDADGVTSGSDFGDSAVVTESSASDSDSAEQSPPTSRPVLVVFPSGIISNPFHATTTSRPSDSHEADSSRDPARPLVLSPVFPHWFYGINPSPWWNRALQLPGIQSRYNDLFDHGLEDELGRGRMLPLRGSNLTSDLLGDASVPSSRLMLRSPVHMMAFTTPATHSSGDAVGSELAIYDFASGQLRRTGQVVTGRLQVTGGHVAFLSSELEQATDLSGDGVMDALVLQVFNPVTGGVRNTGIRAESLRVESGRLILGIRETSQAVPPTASQPTSSRLFAHKFDPTSGQLSNMHRLYDDPAAAWVNGIQVSKPSALEPTQQGDNRLFNLWIFEPSTSNLDFGPNALPLDTRSNRAWPVNIIPATQRSSGESAAPPIPGGPPDGGAAPSPAPSLSGGPNSSARPSITPASGDASAGGE